MVANFSSICFVKSAKSLFPLDEIPPPDRLSLLDGCERSEISSMSISVSCAKDDMIDPVLLALKLPPWRLSNTELCLPIALRISPNKVLCSSSSTSGENKAKPLSRVWWWNCAVTLSYAAFFLPFWCRTPVRGDFYFVLVSLSSRPSVRSIWSQIYICCYVQRDDIQLYGLIVLLMTCW